MRDKIGDLMFWAKENKDIMKTKIKITRYKSGSGKWLETIEEKSTVEPFEKISIQKEIEEKYNFLKNENYVLTVRSIDLLMFNEHLILNDKGA